MRTPSPFLVAPLLACAACTFTGLGNYSVETCSEPAGTTTAVQSVGMLSAAPSFSNVGGGTPIGAFITGGCVEAVGPNGYIQSSCSLLNGALSPQQPWVVPIGGGYAAAAIATVTPCTMGQLSFESISGSGVSPVTQAACTTGATLPSIVPLPDGSSALVAWYETPIASRSDPIQSCSAALAAPLQIAVVSGASSASPSLGMPTTLTSEGVSLRPPAMTAIQGASQVLVAAPDGTAVSVWALASAQSPGSPTSVPGLAGARAVSMAAANDGSDRVAIVAELGCAPQSIALALGSLSGGFGQVTTVVPAGSAAAVQPTVAWVPSQGYWIVSWIAAGGGARALAQRFDSGGNAVGGVVDPSASAIAACAQADGSILAYEPGASGGGFVRTSLGCAQ